MRYSAHPGWPQFGNFIEVRLQIVPKRRTQAKRQSTAPSECPIASRWIACMHIAPPAAAEWGLTNYQECRQLGIPFTLCEIRNGNWLTIIQLGNSFHILNVRAPLLPPLPCALFVHRTFGHSHSMPHIIDIYIYIALQAHSGAAPADISASRLPTSPFAHVSPFDTRSTMSGFWQSKRSVVWVS